MGAAHSYFYRHLNLGCDWRIKTILSGVEWRRQGMNGTYAATGLMVRNHREDSNLQSGVMSKAASFRHFSLLNPYDRKTPLLERDLTSRSFFGGVMDSPWLELLLNPTESTILSVDTSFPSIHDIQHQEQSKNVRCCHWLHTCTTPNGGGCSVHRHSGVKGGGAALASRPSPSPWVRNRTRGRVSTA